MLKFAHLYKTNGESLQYVATNNRKNPYLHKGYKYNRKYKQNQPIQNI